MAKQLRNDPDRRMEMVVISAAASFPATDLSNLDRAQLPRWIEALREAEASTRQLRYQLEDVLREQERKCWACGGPVVGRSDRVYCGATCRQRAHRGPVQGPDHRHASKSSAPNVHAVPS